MNINNGTGSWYSQEGVRQPDFVNRAPLGRERRRPQPIRAIQASVEVQHWRKAARLCIRKSPTLPELLAL
eukprot:COSAG02_NODE_50414_length_320_cov_1.217195_1_plen_69_part_10